MPSLLWMALVSTTRAGGTARSACPSTRWCSRRCASSRGLLVLGDPLLNLRAPNLLGRLLDRGPPHHPDVEELHRRSDPQRGRRVPTQRDPVDYGVHVGWKQRDQ